ncbi:MAG: P-loop NTPase [Deltaproteobacteria bacterium]|nr:P-loop NTPase [Deltaproteobacteria bacterium]
MKLTVAVGGGKGGTGKSLVVANLAVAIAQSGKRVIAVDADLGAANLHTLLGIARPAALLEHFVSRKVERLDQVLVPTQQPGLSVVCGGMAVLGSANPNHAQKQKLIRHIHNLPADAIVVDVGAGSSFNVLDLYNSAAIKLVVLTPEITSVHNAYGFLKAALLRRIAGAVAPGAREQLETGDAGKGAELIKDMIGRLERFDLEQGRIASRVLSEYRIRLVGNMLGAPKEAHVIEAVSRLVTDHLHVDAPIAGLLWRGDKMLRSVNERRPFMLSAGVEANAITFRDMAQGLLAMAPETDIDVDMRLPPAKTYERESPRFPVYLPATLNADGRSLAGEVRNASEGGFLVAFREPMAGVASGRLRVGPAADGFEIAVSVRECHRDPSGLEIGFQLVDATEDVREAMTRLVARAAVSSALPHHEI